VFRMAPVLGSMQTLLFLPRYATLGKYHKEPPLPLLLSFFFNHLLHHIDEQSMCLADS
jgi:hypothetical protein